MSRLYPSLEDMKVDQLQQVQHQVAAIASAAIQYPGGAGATGPVVAPASGSVAVYTSSSLYPSLNEYMGLPLQSLMPVAPAAGQQVAVRATAAGQMQIAPVSGNDVGIRRAEIKQGIREIVLCKDGEGKIGLRVRSVNKGLFVALVHVGSPAAIAGLRFGDQILQINGENVAGWDTDKAMNYLKKCSPERITMAVRDRPFERTITMQKDSTGHIGFVYDDGKITAIVKDSSAARNGVLIDHQLVEVNGQNVVGLKDRDIAEIFAQAPQTVTITIMPTVLYEHVVKCMGNSLIRKLMDHSIPDA